MNILTLDCETTTFEKGNPFSRRNKLCYVGLDFNGRYYDYDIEYSNTPYGQALQDIEDLFKQADLIVGFNLKFDLHWLRRYNGNLAPSCPVWDCQLGEFIRSSQRWVYPDLNEACTRRGLRGKLDVVNLEYWSKGIDTPDVPNEILREYLRRDVEQTRELFDAQYAEFEEGDPLIYNLFKLQNNDLLILEEMEFNGMTYDTKRSLELAEETHVHIQAIDDKLRVLVPVDGLNWNSNDHLSSVLYGGAISLPARIRTERVLKSGAVKVGEKNGWKQVEFPRLVEPLENTETLPTRDWSDDELAERNVGREKPFLRIYQVGESILKSLKARGRAREIITLILERATLEKLHSTYYQGLPNLMIQKDWPEDYIHGQFNQCVAVTGRLSSSGPNQQNFSGDIKPLFYSRYKD